MIRGKFYYVTELADGVEAADSSSRGEPLKPETYVPKPSGLNNPGRPLSIRAMPVRRPFFGERVDHLHKNGLIHHDVKPSNVIFVGGVPKLAGIELVARMSDAQSFIRTPGFVHLRAWNCASRTSTLWKLLYEISTGKEPPRFS
jgi:serine/threonine protein kinase